MIADPIGEAVRWVGDGGLLVYPTETFWGLGADAGSDGAIERLRRWKGRPAGEPISILVEGMAALEPLGFEIGEVARRLAAAFWPGPLTLVMPCRKCLARGVARDDGAVGVRCSSHPLAGALARRLCSEGVGPLTATSLNRSGERPAVTRDEARAACGSGLEAPRMIDVEGAEAGGDLESTVVDVTGPSPQVLRCGAVSARDIGSVLREVAAP